VRLLVTSLGFTSLKCEQYWLGHLNPNIFIELGNVFYNHLNTSYCFARTYVNLNESSEMF